MWYKCKKDYYICRELIFEKDTWYVENVSILNTSLYKLIHCKLNEPTEVPGDIIKKYFYNDYELRELRINMILNDII